MDKETKEKSGQVTYPRAHSKWWSLWFQGLYFKPLYYTFSQNMFHKHHCSMDQDHAGKRAFRVSGQIGWSLGQCPKYAENKGTNQE